MKTIVIDPDKILLDDNAIATVGIMGQAMLTHVYKTRNLAYPKFYKMDYLCRLGFIASELLLDDKSTIDGDSHAIVIVGNAGSLNTDGHYCQTIADIDNYFPSPSVFVYTLANIVTGEIAIRNKTYGETSSFLIDTYDPAMIVQLLLTAFADSSIKTVTGGWIDAPIDNDVFSLRFVTIDRETQPQQIIEFFNQYPVEINR